MTIQITPDVVIEAYLKTRNEIDQLKSKLEKELEPLLELQSRREDWLQKTISDLGLKNLPTKFGTAMITRVESVTCADWDIFIEWVKTNERYEFLERRIAKTPTLELMGEEREQLPPPGVNYTALNKVSVRKK